MNPPRSTRKRKRLVSRTGRAHRGHWLVRIAQRLPGREPTDVARHLSDGPTYETRYWRCRDCGQERNHVPAFQARCTEIHHPTAVADGGYSIEDARTRAALSEHLAVRPDRQPGVYLVEDEQGRTHRVDVTAPTCSCPDTQHRTWCKHLRRVDIEIRTGTVQGLEC